MPRYELQAGQHIQADLRKPIDPKTGKRPSRVYKATPGQPLPVFESESPLCASDPRKFRRVDFVGVPPLTDETEAADASADDGEHNAPAIATLPELDTMTVVELRTLASREGIPLSAEVRTKEAIIAAIRAAI